MRALDPADVAVFEDGQGAVVGVAERQRDFPAPAHLLARIHGLAYPVCGGAPAADGRQIHAYASSKLDAAWMRSSTVSSTRVHGGSMAGCLVRKIASDRWIKMPGIFTRAGVLDSGTVMVII